MTGFVSPLAVLLVGTICAAAALRGLSPLERRLVGLGFASHALASFAQVWVTESVYGGGDMLIYFITGSAIADLVWTSPGHYGPELLALLVHGDSSWPFYVMGAGGATGTMSAVSGILQAVLGNSLHAVCLALSFMAGFGQLAIYRVFRDVYPGVSVRSLALAIVGVPSVVFWTSALLKETVAMASLGWVVYGLHRYSKGHRLRGVVIVLVAGFAVSLVKAYILFAVSIAAGVWWYWRRSMRSSGGAPVRIRPLYLVLSASGVLLLLLALGELFPRYAFDQVVDETARLQEVGLRVRGGSNYQVAESAERSFVAQVALAPVALLTSLFRPTFVEVRNVPMAINALETTALAVLLARSLLRRSARSIIGEVRRSPVQAFSVVFVCLFGVVVGLATTNLGTLSRYRVPLVPFFAVLIAIWGEKRTATQVGPTQARRALA